MNKCMNCKHWKVHEKENRENVEIATCNFLSDICNKTGIMVMDEDFNEHEFLTEKFFGCIHWESE